jgi:hypothetical protein
LLSTCVPAAAVGADFGEFSQETLYPGWAIPS